MLVRENLIRVVANYYRELGELIGLPHGHVRITLSQRRAVKIEVSRKSRICCARLSSNQWDRVQDEEKLVLATAPEYVTSRLENSLVELAGPFGYVEGVIVDHEVISLVVGIQLSAAA